MSTNNCLYSRHSPTSDSIVLPMPSESSVGVHQLNQLSPKKGGHGAGSAKHSASTTNSSGAGSSTIMTLVPASSGGGGSSQTTVTGIVGPTAATGGAAPGSTNKRGRKPGPLSKTAREAQRRLNHSIIEKARRTKINDALATLKQLVPIDYLQTREILKKTAAADENDNDELNDEEGEDDDLDDDDEGGDEEDAEYRDRSSRTSGLASSTMNAKQGLSSSLNTKTNAAPPASKGGKKQEKEKEFKLEILVRTVVFLQDLLERVDHLEAAVGASNSDTVPEHCPMCRNAMSLSPSSSTTTTTNNNKKRKREYPTPSSPTIERDLNDAPHEHGQNRSRVKVARTGDVPPTPRFSPLQQRHPGAQSPRNTAPSSPSLTAENKRLPSISSWLNNDEHGPILPSPLSFGTFVGTVAGKEGGRNKIIYSPRNKISNASSSSSSYLPSPPPTTHCFDPIRTYTSTQVPPLLNLGPGATSSSSSGTRSSKSFGKSPANASGTFATRPPPSSSTPPTPLILTPEDESAASMLLQIASSTSPLFRPINPPAFSASSSSAPFDSSRSRSTTTSPNFPGNLNTKNANALPEPTHFSLYSSHQNSNTNPHAHSHPQPHQTDNQQRAQTQYDDQSIRQVETPSSMLGIRKY